MSKSINRVILVGRLGRDPEMRSTAQGKPVCDLSLATNRRTGPAGADGERPTEVTDWHKVVAWEKLAETCHRYLTKGQQVYVEGRIQNKRWTTPDGQPRLSTEVIASDVMFLSPKREAPPEGATATPFDPTEAW
jgi:single-strand DNA-binding protein